MPDSARSGPQEPQETWSRIRRMLTPIEKAGGDKAMALADSIASAIADEIEELKVADIVSRNPGIDPDEVRRFRKTGAR